MSALPASRRRAAVLTAGAVLAGCALVPRPTDQELRALDAPPPALVARIDALLPAALAWYAGVEARLAPQGRALSADETAAALQLGVREPGRVRVLVLEAFPLPDDPALRAGAERLGLGGRLEGGRTNGHLVLLKPELASDLTVLRHELVHVAQIERMGIEAFLRRYLVEVEMLGYARAPLELEAYDRQ